MRSVICTFVTLAALSMPALASAAGKGLEEYKGEEAGVSFDGPKGWTLKKATVATAHLVQPKEMGGAYLAIAAAPESMGMAKELLEKTVKGKAKKAGKWVCATGGSPRNEKQMVAVCVRADAEAKATFMVALGAMSKKALAKAGGIKIVQKVAATLRGFKPPAEASK